MILFFLIKQLKVRFKNMLEFGDWDLANKEGRRAWALITGT